MYHCHAPLEIINLLVINFPTKTTVAGLFVTFPAQDEKSQPSIILLAFKPLLDQTRFNAENHYEFILLQMADYGLPLLKRVCLIGDNCSTKTATTDMFGVPLLGCRSYRFNLAVEKYIDTTLGNEAKCVGDLMSKLSTLKEAGRLRLKTHLRPVKRNVTRWLGVVNMFDRFLKLSDEKSIDETAEGIAVLMPTALQRETIRSHSRALAEFKAVTLTLQS